MDKAVTSVLERAVANKVFPGAVVGVYRESTQKVIPFGTLDYSDPVTKDTIYDVASITKAIPTSSLALSLVDSGQLSLENTITEYIPEFRHSMVTIWHLLTQTLALEKDGAIIRGQETFHAEEKNNQQLVSSIFKTTILKLITDILFALLLVYLFPGVLRRIIQLATSQKVRSGLTGLGILFLGPVVSLFLLFILWLGISSWLLYFLLLVLALMIGKFILGWWALKWWYGREKKEYVLDWKVAIVGPALTALLAFIPVLGWIILAALYLISLGALALSAYNLRKLK